MGETQDRARRTRIGCNDSRTIMSQKCQDHEKRVRPPIKKAVSRKSSSGAEHAMRCPSRGLRGVQVSIKWEEQGGLEVALRSSLEAGLGGLEHPPPISIDNLYDAGQIIVVLNQKVIV
jgi:hypothetical protein